MMNILKMMRQHVRDSYSHCRSQRNQMIKLISWNVNGIRAAVGKGFLDFFHEIDADVFCVQETKLQEGQIELDLPGYYDFWNRTLHDLLISLLNLRSLL